MAVSGCIINLNPRLYIVHIHMKGKSFSFIFHRLCLHLHAGCNKIIPLINRCYTVTDMMFCLFYIICHHVFKWKHSIHIHISCPCNEILFIGIFRSELIADQMTPIIQILSIYIIILDRMPSGWFDLPYFSSFLIWHQLFSNHRFRHATSAFCIQFTVRLKHIFSKFCLRKIRFVIMNRDIGLSRIFRY